MTSWVRKRFYFKSHDRLNIDEFTEKEIANMDIPIMEFSYGEKVHRSDVTYALFNLTPLMKDMGPDFETEKKR